MLPYYQKHSQHFPEHFQGLPSWHTLSGTPVRVFQPRYTIAIVAIAAAIYRSLKGLWGLKSPKSLKKVFPDVPARSVKKVLKKKVPNDPKISQKDCKISARGLFDTSLTLRAGRPGNTFLRLFGDFGARGCGDSCKDLEPPDVGLAPTALRRVTPSPPLHWRTLPS